MALFVLKMGKFMKKGYGARKRRDHTKSKEYVIRCYNCKSPDHVEMPRDVIVLETVKLVLQLADFSAIRNHLGVVTA